MTRGDSMENMCTKILRRNDRFASQNRAQLLESAAQDEANMAMAREKIVLIEASATRLRKQLQRDSVMKARLQ